MKVATVLACFAPIAQISATAVHIDPKVDESCVFTTEDILDTSFKIGTPCADPCSDDKICTISEVTTDEINCACVDPSVTERTPVVDESCVFTKDVILDTSFKIGTPCADPCSDDKICTISEVTTDEINCACVDPPTYVDLPIAGQLCDFDELSLNHNVIKACCETDDKESECGDYQECRIQTVTPTDTDNAVADIECKCTTPVDVGDKCDADLPYVKEGETTCENGGDCRVTAIVDDNTVDCGCAEVNKECEVYAYDSCDYCRENPPAPCPKDADDEEGNYFEVSVSGDATYKIKADDINQICSGDDPETPSGSLCPKEGDQAIKDCRKEVLSWESEEVCIAPQDAKCMKLKSSNASTAWGCVFPINANEKIGCLAENVCTDEYEKVEGTELCKCTAAGYPVLNKTVVDADDYIDTSNKTVAEPNVSYASYKVADKGDASIHMVNLIVGMFTIALSIFFTL